MTNKCMNGNEKTTQTLQRIELWLALFENELFTPSDEGKKFLTFFYFILDTLQIFKTAKILGEIFHKSRGCSDIEGRIQSLFPSSKRGYINLLYRKTAVP